MKFFGKGLAVDTPWQAYRFGYQYDANGNLTNDGRMAYFWNDENRLVAVRNAKTGALIQENRYDGLGRRREKVELDAGVGVTNRYIYKDWLVLAITDGAGNVLETYTHGADLSGHVGGGAGGIGGILASTKAGGPAYYHYDFNGNIVNVSSTNQTQLAKYTYSPFGEVLLKEGDFDSRYQFSTKEYDPSTGLNYYGFRFYSPELGRWISREPLGESGGLNLYGFGPNNPVNGFDYLGLAWGNARALWHYYFGGGRDVTLGEIGHYGTVTAAVQPKMDEWKQKAIDAAVQAGGGLSCPNNTSDSVSDSDSVGVHSGVWWIGGISFARSYSCSVQIDGDCDDCPETWSYSCSMSYSMNDEFSGILDHDNSGDDPWDAWTLGGTPFSVTGSWSDEASGGGSL